MPPRASEEARRTGASFVFLLADAQDWPRRLYGRLGFDPNRPLAFVHAVAARETIRTRSHRVGVGYHRPPMSSIESVHAREILDSRGNPTVEVEVALDDGGVRARRRARAAPRPASTRRSSCATATEALPRQGRAQRGRERERAASPRRSSALDALDQRGVDAALIDARRHADKSRARRQRRSSASRWRWRGPPPTRPGCRSTATSAGRTRTSCRRR